MGPSGHRKETKASDEAVRAREVLYELFRQRPLPDEDLFISFGLYLRSSALAKILFLDELYRQILDVPGAIVEFGTWRGQNVIVFENLRAIYEPFDQGRRIVAFDTFTGYPELGARDREGRTLQAGGYAMEAGYRGYLERLIAYHEGNNVLGDGKKHTVIEGDVTLTAPRFFKENPETVVALAYFDMALYEPTKAALRSVLPHVVPGSVLMLDELGSRDYPGETIAFKEEIRDRGVRYRTRRSRYMPERTLLIIETAPAGP